MNINSNVSKFKGNVLSENEEEKVPQHQKSKDVDMEVEGQNNTNFQGNTNFDEEGPQTNLISSNDMIGVRPQGPMMPGCVYEEEELVYRYLCWNPIGSVALRNEMDSKYVEIEFADKTFHKTLITENDINAELATLSHNGALLASKGEEIDLDQYEDDTDDLRYISQLKFVPFSSWNSIKPWRFNLPKGENIEGIAIGSTF